MIVKIDVDEVLRNILPTICDINNELTEEHKTIEDITVYDVNTVFPKILETTGKTAQEVFFSDYAFRVFNNSPIFIGAKEAIDNLHKHGYYISVVTHQPDIMAKWYTLCWLKNNEVYYDEIHFTNNKQNVYGDIVIDDNPNVISKERPSVIKCLIKKPYNISSDYTFNSLKECSEFIIKNIINY